MQESSSIFKLWEHDSEASEAIVGAGEEGEGAAVFGEDVADEEETKSLTLGLGGEERSKEMLGNG